MNKLQKLATKIATNKNTPIVLTAVACSGVVITGIMAAKGGTKASQILSDKDPNAPFRQKLKWTWKCYAPAAGVGLTTIAAIVTMNRVAARNAAILTAGATLATTTLQEYQQHVLEEIGAERESKIRKKIAKRQVESSDISQAGAIVITGDDCLCYDTYSGQYFRGNATDIRKIENEINREILQGVSCSVSLNEVYDQLGIPTNAVGETVGFNIDNLVDIFFASDLSKDKKPVLAISFIKPPVADFANFT